MAKCDICDNKEGTFHPYVTGDDSSSDYYGIIKCDDCPLWKHKIGFEDYDADVDDEGRSIWCAGGIYYTLCIFDNIKNEWIDWDCWYEDDPNDIIRSISQFEDECN